MGKHLSDDRVREDLVEVMQHALAEQLHYFLDHDYITKEQHDRFDRAHILVVVPDRILIETNNVVSIVDRPVFRIV